jgi:hypothetical protein
MKNRIYRKRAIRYIEPEPNNPIYLKYTLKPCSVCGRLLPDSLDFFSIHAVREYRYRRPECRTCRAKQMRQKHKEKAGAV